MIKNWLIDWLSIWFFYLLIDWLCFAKDPWRELEQRRKLRLDQSQSTMDESRSSRDESGVSKDDYHPLSESMIPQVGDSLLQRNYVRFCKLSLFKIFSEFADSALINKNWIFYLNHIFFRLWRIPSWYQIQEKTTTFRID